MKKRWWVLGAGLLVYVAAVGRRGGSVEVPPTQDRPVPRVGGYVRPRAGSFRCTSGDEHRQLMQLMGSADREARARFIRERQSCVVMLNPEPLQVTGAEGIDYLQVAVPGEYQRWVVQRELVQVIRGVDPAVNSTP